MSGDDGDDDDDDGDELLSVTHDPLNEGAVGKRISRILQSFQIEPPKCTQYYMTYQ